MADPTVEIPTRTLVFGMVGEDGAVAASDLYAVADACGQSTEQVRSCLRRLVAEGLLLRNGGPGRDANFRLTPDGMAALGAIMERTRLAYGQDAAGRGWDRQWRLVAFAVSEQKRVARDAFRDQLRSLGGAAIQNGLYVSPHQWHKDAKARAERLGIADAVTLSTTDDLDIGGETDPRELTRRLWPVEDLAARYRAFIDKYEVVPDSLTVMRRERRRLPDTAFLPGALAMTVAYLTCFNDDPLLPPELLPRPWPGRVARDLLLRSRRLALSAREAGGRPALFRLFDDAVNAIP
ncbi:MAG: transcriptional regulator [Acidimicrobiia bacterium]|nr:transcriptional regulator [Acidimicrobiia bacterium]